MIKFIHYLTYALHTVDEYLQEQKTTTNNWQDYTPVDFEQFDDPLPFRTVYTNCNTVLLAWFKWYRVI